MMGLKERHFTPLDHLSLDDLVPADHFYRHLDRTLDLSFVRSLVAPYYAVGGRPSIDPVVFFKLQLVLFFEGLHSERQLMRVVADRLSVRWYLGYDLGETLPDHSSLTKIRERYGVDAFRRFFEAIVEQCRAARLVWGRELYVDATQVDANASLDSVKPRFAVDEHLRTLFSAGATLPSRTPDDSDRTPMTAAPPLTLPTTPDDDVAEANAQRHDWIEDIGHPQREVTTGSYRRVADYQMSTTDPDATLMLRKGGGPHLGYRTHTMVDGGKARIILQTLVTPAEIMENQPMLDLLWRVRFRWRLHPHHVTGDTTYGTVEIIKAVEEEGMRAYMPLPDNDKRTPFFGKHAFVYDPARDAYTCPARHTLPYTSVSTADQLKVYYADRKVCNACPLKAKCTRSQQGRRISRHIDEAYVERVRTYQETEAYQKARRKRQVWVEPLFAEAKDWHGLRRFRLRGLERVNIEALVTTTGQNLKRLLSRRGWGRRPWPDGALGLRVAPRPLAPLAR